MAHFPLVSHLLVALLMGLLAAVAPPEARCDDLPYSTYLHGRAGDAQVRARGGVALIGGAADPLDTAFRWMVERASGGDFVVIRASGDGEYNTLVAPLGPLDSVETIVLHTPEAGDSAHLAARVAAAEAIFLAGGDQSNYLGRIQGRALEAAIHTAVSRGAVLGGTSAGLAVLGRHAFGALRDTITSAEALEDPFDPRVTMVTGFLEIPHLERICTDSHFSERDRMGRLMVFLARLRQGADQGALGLGVDEETALLLEPGGSGTVVGKGGVHLVVPSHRPAVCEPGRPLSWDTARVDSFKAGDRVDRLDCRVAGGTRRLVTVRDGVMSWTGRPPAFGASKGDPAHDSQR